MDGRRSIQDIIPPARSRPIRPPQQQQQGGTEHSEPPPTPPPPMDLNPNRPRGFLAFIFVLGGLLLIASIVVGALSTVFHKAYITVSPYEFDAPVNDTFLASVSGENLSYDRVSTETTKTKTVEATGSADVEDRASGTIIVYNAYSTKNERLITNTRFETKGGLIFRVHEPVVVPGYTTKAGVKVPGSVEVKVHADEPGEKYNVGLEEFTIPGLKGSEQYTLLFAKSKTPMSGGFVGKRAIVNEAVRTGAVAELKAELDRELREKIRTVVPFGSVVFDSTVAITYAEGTDRIEGANAVISVSGIAHAPAFDESQLATVIAEGAQIQYAGALSIENEAALTATVSDPTSVVSDADVSLSISGTAQLKAVYDENELIAQLSGKSEEDITAVRANFPSIESLTVRIYPFWRGSIPALPERIELRTEIEQ